MKRLKSLAIIGSRGMVGSDLVKYLIPYFENTAEIDRESYERYRGKSFDTVINANGNSNKIWAKEHVLDDFSESVTSTYKSLYDFPCKTYIYVSSADVYENHTSKKFTSESKNINPENLTSYGFHKYLSECIVKNYKKEHVILRCPMILGSKLKKGPIYDILHNSRLFVSKNSAFQMITTKELAQIIHALLSQNITHEIFNVGGKGTVLLNRIIEYIKQPIIFPKNETTHIYEMDVSKLHKIYKLKTSGEYLQDFLKEL